MDHEHQEHHIASTGMYLTIFGILMVCTMLTVWVSYINLGALNILVALGIAIFKATLVIMYFMHVKWSQTLSKVSVVTSVAFLFILLLLTGVDYASRQWMPKNQGWEKHQVVRP